ncbi:MAG: autotransporter domain-containing protein [Gemmatimonadaceae bacterium]|nr:autotransporter domain-containing protein [Gemmatimonadaceae bacterium]
MRKTSILAALLLIAPAALQAQASTYPSFQPTRIAEREYNFGLADFDGGTALIAQWREGLGNPRLQFTGDVGLSDVGDETGLIIGGSLHYQLTTASQDMPFDMVLGGGLGMTLHDNFNLLRVPFGVAIGHRFPLEGSFAISPYVHPRLSYDRVSVDGFGDNSETNLDLDIGANFELNAQMQIRLAATLGDGNSVGFAFAWSPRGLR